MTPTPFAHLGPMPRKADDTDAIAILAFDTMAVLTPLGEALVRMTVRSRQPEAADARLLITVNPRTLQITRVTARILPDGREMPLAWVDLPGMVLDLAQSATRDRFPRTS